MAVANKQAAINPGIQTKMIGSAIHGELHAIGLVAAIIVDVAALYMLFRPYKEATKLTTIN